MANTRLSVRPSIRFAGMVAVVIALHAWVLRWLGDALESPTPIRPMATPMFTRLLQPEAPRPATAAAAPPSPKRRDRLTAVRTPAARPAAKPASAPQPSASAPEPAVATSPPAEDIETLDDPLATVSGSEGPAAAAATASEPTSAASAPASASLDSWPVDTRVSYRLTGWYRGELTGSARVQWLRQRDRYEVRVDLDLGLFGMQFLSQGEVTGETLAPGAYQESRPGRTRIVQLGPENVVLNDGRSLAKPAGVQDSASQFVELGHRFASGREDLAVGSTTSVWLARPGGVDLWTYDVTGLDRLTTPRLGAVDAFHLKPRPIADARGDIYVEIWLAPRLQYLPVRIRINQGSESWVDILVERIEQR